MKPNRNSTTVKPSQGLKSPKSNPYRLVFALAPARLRAATARRRETFPGCFSITDKSDSIAEVLDLHEVIMTGEHYTEEDEEYAKIGRWLSHKMAGLDYKCIARLAERIRHKRLALDGEPVKSRRSSEVPSWKILEFLIPLLEKYKDDPNSLPPPRELFSAYMERVKNEQKPEFKMLRQNFYRFLRKHKLGAFIGE